MLKLLGAFGLTLLLFLAACGGGDDGDDGSTDDAAGEPTATATTGGDDGGDETQEPEDTEDAGGDATGDGGDSNFHACSLFTAAEVGAVLDAEVSEGRDYLATAPGATQCTWETTDGSSAVFIEVLLDGGQDWFDAVHIEGDQLADIEELDGLGDVAVYDKFLNTVDVVDDDRFVSVQPVLFFSDLDDKTVGVELAEMTLERLP